jgi:type IV pilus biogenesis protein CpaD/CtpE
MKNIAYKILAIGLIAACAACAPENEKVSLITGTKDSPTVIPPKCPDWTDPEEHSNFGCANITNYGQMIEDPNDMITGKSNNLTNAARSGLPVSAYEAGQPSSAASPASSSPAATPQ